MSDKKYERGPQISVGVTPELYKAIAAAAKAEGRMSIASWMRRLAEVALASSGRGQTSKRKAKNDLPKTT